MDVLWILVITACLGVVLYWYIVNEIEDEDGTAGILALSEDASSVKSAKFGDRLYAYRVRLRNAFKRRHTSTATARPTHKSKGDVKAYRMKGEAHVGEQPRSRYRGSASGERKARYTTAKDRGTDQRFSHR